MLKKYKRLFDKYIEQAGDFEITYVGALEEDLSKILCDMDDAGNLYIKPCYIPAVFRISPVLIIKALQKKYIDARLFGCVVDKNIMHVGTFMAIAEYIEDLLDDSEVDPEKLAKECARYDAKDLSELKTKIADFAFSITKTDVEFFLVFITTVAFSKIRLHGREADSFDEIQRIVS